MLKINSQSRIILTVTVHAELATNSATVVTDFVATMVCPRLSPRGGFGESRRNGMRALAVMSIAWISSQPGELWTTVGYCIAIMRRHGRRQRGVVAPLSVCSCPPAALLRPLLGKNSEMIKCLMG